MRSRVILMSASDGVGSLLGWFCAEQPNMRAHAGEHQGKHNRDAKKSPVKTRYLHRRYARETLPLGASVSGALNQIGDFSRFGNVNSMTAGHFCDLCFCAPRHRPLGWRRNHLIFRGNQVKVRLGFPSRFRNGA